MKPDFENLIRDASHLTESDGRDEAISDLKRLEEFELESELLEKKFIERKNSQLFARSVFYKNFMPLLLTLTALSLPILFINSIVLEEKIIFIMGLFMSGLSGKILLLSIASNSWPIALGRIISSKVVALGRGNSSVMIEYSYNVKGQEYKGNVISYKIKPFTNPAAAGRFASKFFVDNQVNVRYMPTNPAVSVLKHGVQFITAFMFISGICIVAAMIFKILSI